MNGISLRVKLSPLAFLVFRHFVGLLFWLGRRSSSLIDDINKEAKKVTKKLDISDRVEKMPKKDAFITLKDHKEEFRTKKSLECRLIKPSKCDLGKISKRRLEIITQIIRLVPQILGLMTLISIRVSS